MLQRLLRRTAARPPACLLVRQRTLSFGGGGCGVGAGSKRVGRPNQLSTTASNGTSAPWHPPTPTLLLPRSSLQRCLRRRGSLVPTSLSTTPATAADGAASAPAAAAAGTSTTTTTTTTPTAAAAAAAAAAAPQEVVLHTPPLVIRAALVGATTALMTPVFPVMGFNFLAFRHLDAVTRRALTGCTSMLYLSAFTLIPNALYYAVSAVQWYGLGWWW
jgi:hypothetical protein